jgi:hypothetical protein
LEDEGPVGVVEERVCASSAVVLALPGMGEQEGSEELEARDAGGCADGMLLFPLFLLALYWWWDYFAIKLLRQVEACDGLFHVTLRAEDEWYIRRPLKNENKQAEIKN